MAALGMICEWNPFHLGHAWLLRELKRCYSLPVVYIFAWQLCVLRGQFIPCLLHGVRRKKKLAALGKDLNVAADITKLLGHGVYRLSYLV